MATTLRDSASATATGTSVGVVVPAGTVSGDLLVLFVVAGWFPLLPDGWNQLEKSYSYYTNYVLCWRLATDADAGATITTYISGGSFDSFAALAVVTGGTSIKLDSSSVANGVNTRQVSTTDGEADDRVLWFGYHRTNTGTPTAACDRGATVETASTTNGGGVLAHEAGPGSVTATISSNVGGSGAYGCVAASVAVTGLRNITATEMTTEPPRVGLAVTGLTPSDVVTVYRYADGTPTAVRGAEGVTVDDTALAVFDAEAPFGTPVHYTAVVNDVEVADTDDQQFTLSSGGAVLSDAITGRYCYVTIVDWEEKEFQRKTTVFRVGQRTVVVSGDRGMSTSQLTLYTPDAADRATLSELLSTATAGVLQLRQAGGYTDIDDYLVVLTETQRRLTSRGADEKRLWVLDVAQTQSWAPELLTFAYTFEDVDTAYDGLTFADLDTDFAAATFLDFDLTDWLG
jgi:hypothetical protein